MVLSSPTHALLVDNIIIVFQDTAAKGSTAGRAAVAYVGGDEIPAVHVGGKFRSEPGHLTTVVGALNDGALLRLADGSMLSVPEYDRYDTGWWLHPYRALLTRNKMHLWNLKKGKRIWIDPR
jgi:hypothetical protein